MRLRLRQHKRVVVGLSSIAGWGAFLMVGSSASSTVQQCATWLHPDSWLNNAIELIHS